MGLENALLIADVSHARLRPKRNAFRYRVYYLCLPLAALDTLAKLAVMARNRFNLFSFHDRDHAPMGGSCETYIRNVLAQWNITQANGDVVLLTLPRILGYVFNPVSFWFCLDTAGQVRCVLSEVRNTFGERHCYLSYHDDQRPITADDWLESEKVFHVSPFIAREGFYRFRFAYGEQKIGVWIDYHDADGLMLTTAITGKRRPASSASLLYCFIRYPMVTLKVIGLIHYQALKLVSKGITYRNKPPQQSVEISR